MAGTEYIIKYISDIKEAQKGANQLEQINKDIAQTIGKEFANATEVIGKSQQKLASTPFNFKGAEVKKDVEAVSQVVKSADGTFQEFTKTQTFLNGTLVKTAGTMKDVTSQFKQTDVTTAKLAASKKSLFQIMGELAARALIIVPIWGLMRNALQGLSSAISNSIAGIAKESLILEKARQTLTGTTSEIRKNFQALKEESESLALQTGVDQDKIISVFQKFSAIGLSYAAAMTAANAATKLAVITQTDAAESADNFATSINLLVDKTQSVEGQSKQITEIFALIGELAQKNNLNISEFSGSLEKFAVTAKSANFTTSQTIALLATLSKSGLGQAGNVLRNSLGQLLSNLDKLAGSLGIKVNPALDDTFSILVKVLDQVNKLQNTGDLTGLTQARDALKDLFGGTRGAVPITALAALSDSLKENLSLAPDIDNFNKRFKETEEVTGSIIKRIHNINKETGEAFITGIGGGDNFNDSLKRIADTLVQVQKNAEGFGRALNNILTLKSGVLAPILIPLEIKTKVANLKQTIGEDIKDGLKGSLKTEDLTNLFNTLLKAQTLKIDIGLSDRTLAENINLVRNQIVKQTEEAANATQKQVAVERNLLDIQLKKEDFLKLETLLKKELAASGQDEVAIEAKVLELRSASGQFLESDLKLQKELVESLKDIQDIEVARATAKGVVDSNVELLRIQGASNVELLKARNEYEKELKINQSRVDLLNKQIELEKAITAEKLGQNTISNNAQKVFDIAKENGINAAKAIADVLSGETNFETFFRIGGENLEIFKNKFADIFKTQQANAFFRGDIISGLNDVQGGSDIFRTPQIPIGTQRDLTGAIGGQNQQSIIDRLLGTQNSATGVAREVFASRPPSTVQRIDINVNGQISRLTAESPAALEKIVDELTPKVMASVKKSLQNPFSPIGEQDRKNTENF